MKLNLRIYSKPTAPDEFRQYACASNSDILVVILEQLKELRDDIFNHSTRLGWKRMSTMPNWRNSFGLTMLSKFCHYVCTGNSNSPLSIVKQLKQLRDGIHDHGTQFGLKYRLAMLNLRVRSKPTVLDEFCQYACASNSDILIVVLEQLKELWDDVLDRSTQLGLKRTSAMPK